MVTSCRRMYGREMIRITRTILAVLFLSKTISAVKVVSRPGVIRSDPDQGAECALNATTAQCFSNDVYAESIFLHYGYSTNGLLRDLDSTDQAIRLLDPERDIHPKNMADWKQIGRGTEGTVYVATLLATNASVAVKIMHQMTVNYIMREVHMLTYLQDTGYVPAFYGLLPTSNLASELAITVEYINGSDTFQNTLFPEYGQTRLTPKDCLNIGLAVAIGIQTLHQKHVLLNDIHANNILLQPRANGYRVVFVDIGYATFRHGMTYRIKEDYGTYIQLAPEVMYDWNFNTIPPSDVFSLGSLMNLFLYVHNIPIFADLATRCLQKDYNSRPPLEDIIDALQRNLGYRDTNENKLQPANPVSHDKLYGLPFLKFQDVEYDTDESGDLVILEEIKNSSLYLGTLLANVSVCIHQYYNRPIADIMQIGHILNTLNGSNAIPYFYGLWLVGHNLTDTTVILEHFWDDYALGYLLELKESRVDWIRILRNLVKSVGIFHKNNILINTLNIWGTITNEQSGYNVRIINIELATNLTGVRLNIKPGENYEYLAPEIHQGHRTTVASDMYSLCVIIDTVIHAKAIYSHQLGETISVCLGNNPNDRPSLSTISGALNVKNTRRVTTDL